MAKSQGAKFTTQIIYRRNGDEHVVGYVARYDIEGDFLYNYHWSRDGKHWSRKWLTYNQAVRQLLVQTGHQKTDEYYIVPFAETQKSLWL